MSEVQVPVPNFNDNIMHHQMNFLREFDSGLYHSYMLNWHRRARKTTMSLNLIFRECCKYPNRTYAYVAPTLKQGRKIIWLDPMMLHRYLPMDYVEKINETESYVKFKNGSMFVLLGSEDDDAVRGTNAHGYLIDEWGAYDNPVVWDILRPILAEKRSAGINPWVIFIFTPKGRNHCFEMWNKSEVWDGWYRSELNVDDTQIVTPEILAQEREEMLPSLFRQEYYCDFTSDDERVVISWQEIQDLKRNIIVDEDKRRFVVADPSLGGDCCPIMAFEGTSVVETQRLVGERDLMVVVGHIVIMMNKYNTRYCVIDSNGLGEGVSSRIRELGYKVIDFRGSEKVREDQQCRNKRTEAIFYLLAEMKRHRVSPIEDKKISDQLTSIRYVPAGSSGKIALEEKKVTKKRIKSSPDDADCYIMGIYEHKNIPRYDYGTVEVWRRPPSTRRKKNYAGNSKGY